MVVSDVKLLEEYGWEVQSHEPFIIRHAETHSFATRDAAEIILESYKRRQNELPESFRATEREIFPSRTPAPVTYGKVICIEDPQRAT